MRLNSTPIYLSATVLLSLAATFLVYRHAQLRLRFLRDANQQRANLIAKLREEHESLSELSRKQTALQISDIRFNEVLKLRGEIGVLRRTLQELTATNGGQDLSRSEVLMCKNQLFWDRVNLLKQLFEEMSAVPVPEFQYMSFSNWQDLLKYEPEIRKDGRFLSSLRSLAQIDFALGVLSEAIQSYATHNNGKFPAAISDLEGYFKSPVDGSVLENWVILPTRSLPNWMRVDGDWAITQKAAVNPELEQRIVIGLNSSCLGSPGDWRISP